MIELARQRNMSFTHVGGLTMGADPLAHGIAMVADVGWFSRAQRAEDRGAASSGSRARSWIMGTACS